VALNDLPAAGLLTVGPSIRCSSLRDAAQQPFEAQVRSSPSCTRHRVVDADAREP
jgi:hypothetical protein